MTWFPDWVTGRFPLAAEHQITGGMWVEIDEHGAVTKRLDRRLSVVGSHSSVVQVRTIGRDLEVSGNPTKWLQGHNLFGTSRLCEVLGIFAVRLCEVLDLDYQPEDVASWYSGRVVMSRLDVTRMYKLPSGMVPKWLSVASAAAYGGHQRVTNRGGYDTGTLYVGQHSRRISMKLYDKAAELRKHPLAATIASEYADKLRDWASDTLRVEVTVRAMELKARGKGYASDWSCTDGDAVIEERLGKLSMLDNLKLADDIVDDLPRRLRGPYALWHDGHDLRQLYKKSQFYAYRSELLKFGVDILKVRPRVLQPTNEYALGVPMRSFLDGGGIPAPEWAEGTSLLVG